MVEGMKDWLRQEHISQRRLAVEMKQSKSNISKKINGQTRWTIDDLHWLKTNYGLSYDFVLDSTQEVV